jgi:predicted nucleotidyltransferase
VENPHVGFVDIPPAISEVVGRLATIPAVECVVLFGSRARGDAEPRSDVDLAVSCPGASPLTWSEISEIVDGARTLLMIDLIRLEDAPDALRASIDLEGVTLYERA